MPPTHKDLWKQVLAMLEIELDPAIVSTWFKNTQLYETSENKIIIACGDSYGRNIIQKRYSEAIETILTDLYDRKMRVEFIVKPQKIQETITGPLFDEAPEPTTTNHNQPPSQSHNTGFDSPDSTTQPKPTAIKRTYTLDNYVVGVSNRVVHAAAMSVIETPGVIYNPLFIYGNTGVGKTHIMHAIGNAIHEHNPHFRILYTTSEQFVNDLIDHIRQKKQMSQFRDKYRTTDVLLIDDIQFIAGKEASEEEFYHTFNELYNAEHQVVLASDREPDQIEGLADRLMSRFQGGLMVKIDPPDYETRLAIVQTKAIELDMDLTPPIIDYLAEHTGQNVREIQGYMLQLKSYALSQQTPINLAMARSILEPKQDLEPRRKITPEYILELVTETFDTSIKDLCGKKRKKEIVVPRQLAMFLLRNELGMNLTEIGEILGGRDHTTIMHGCEKVKTLIEQKQNPLLSTHLSSIRQTLYS